MPIHHAVLGLLADGPGYGYQLKADFEAAIGPQWGEVNIGHLYQILDRLMRDRLVTRRAVSQSDRPDKLVYRLTKGGRQELERWLGSPIARQSGYRDDLFLKILVGSRLGLPELRRVLRIQREAYVSELAGLSELRARHGSDPLVDLLIEAATLHAEANVRLTERALEQANLISKHQRREVQRRPSVPEPGSSQRRAAASTS
jgi:DNA-binding PadR family transcriptional regulator